jgi:hypothetical protein
VFCKTKPSSALQRNNHKNKKQKQKQKQRQQPHSLSLPLSHLLKKKCTRNRTTYNKTTTETQTQTNYYYDQKTPKKTEQTSRQKPYDFMCPKIFVSVSNFFRQETCGKPKFLDCKF